VARLTGLVRAAESRLRGFPEAVPRGIADPAALFADPILTSFAATDAVAHTAQAQAIWLVLIPFAGVAGFVFDGVFVGASWTRALLLSMLGATLVYAAALWFAWPHGNWGLWLAFTLFLVARASLQATMLPALMRRWFGATRP